MTADLWLTATTDPGVVAIVLARDAVRVWNDAAYLSRKLSEYGITATEDQARALLDAVAAWDEHDARWGCLGRNDCEKQDRLIAAVTAIVGEQP